MIEEVTEDYENKIKENKMLKKELATSKAEVEELAQRLRDESDRWDNLDDKCEKLETENARLYVLIRKFDESWKEKCIEADTMRQHYKNAHKVNQKLEEKIERLSR